MKKVLASLAAAIAAASASEAATYTWSGLKCGAVTWNDAGNWTSGSGTTYPNGANDKARIDVADGCVMTMTGGPDCLSVTVSGGTLVFDCAGGLDDNYVRGAATITVGGGAKVVVDTRLTPYNSGKTFTKDGAGGLVVDLFGKGTSKYFGVSTVSSGKMTVNDSVYATGFTVSPGAELEKGKSGGWAFVNATEETPGLLQIDGGRLSLSGVNGDNTLFTSSAYARLLVGAAGASVASVDNKRNRRGAADVGYGAAPRAVFNHAFEKSDGIDAAGPVEFRGWAQFEYARPFATGGDLKFMDGGHFAADADEIDAAGGAFFGTGDMLLRGATLGVLPGVDPASSLKLATGEGKALAYSGSAGIVGRYSSDDAPKSIVIGALSRAGKGSLLFIRNQTDGNALPADCGAAGGPSVKVTGGVPTDARGVCAIPVAEYSMPLTLWPMKYDSGNGFVSMTSSDLSEGLVAGEYSGLSEDSSLSSDLQVAGLYVGNKKLSLSGGATLTIGDGVNPAYVWYRNNSTIFDGMGYVDFGGSEGVFLCANSYRGDGSLVAVPLRGSGGITFAGAHDLSCQPSKIRLAAANEHTGGTYIAGAVVYAAAPGCFSSGDVHVLGGEMAGGTVRFDADGTWTNDFTVGGFGIRTEKYNKTPFGALVFSADAIIDGDVALTEHTRVSMWTNAANAAILGMVSGDRLSVYSYQDWNGGVLELAGDNTYTGGTEVVKQALAVRTASGFGTGDVELHDGTLVFRNDSAVTIANRISGSGALRVEGEGAVSLANAAGLVVSEFQVGAGRHEFTSDFAYRPLVASSERGKRAVLVLKAPGTYTLSQNDLSGLFEIVLEAGATLDLGGEALAVFRFSGSKSAVNGTIVETNPSGGMTILFR